jgi:hypothetical protein
MRIFRQVKRRMLHRVKLEIEVAVLVVLVLLVAVGFSSPGITGFVTGSTVTQTLGLTIDSSQELSIALPFGKEISSVRLSGVTSGEGSVSAWVITDEQELLSYSNAFGHDGVTGFEHITGRVTGPVSVLGTNPISWDGQGEFSKVYEGPFSNACVDTCRTPFLSDVLTLRVLVAPGSQITIDDIIFTSIN